MSNKMTKSERKILELVKRTNELGALCGLGTSPKCACWNDNETRFIRRLVETGMISWVPWDPQLGAGFQITDRGTEALQAE